MVEDFAEISFNRGDEQIMFKYPSLNDISFWTKNNHPEFASYKLLKEGNFFVKYFKFPIGEDLQSSVLPGFDFLLKNKGSRISNLPLIYDIKWRDKDGHSEYFVFLELLNDAYPLDKIFLETKTQFKMLYQHLAQSLRGIHSLGFWHPDLKEGNILFSDRKFFLIDIDSVMDVRDDFNWLTLSNVNKDLSILVDIFFKHEKISLRGDELNLLQLLMLMVGNVFRKNSYSPYVHISKLASLREFEQYLYSHYSLNSFLFEFHKQDSYSASRYVWLSDKIDALIKNIL